MDGKKEYIAVEGLTIDDFDNLEIDGKKVIDLNYLGDGVYFPILDT